MTKGDTISEEEEEKEMKKKQKLDHHHHPVPDHGGDVDTTEDSGGGCSRDMETDQPISPASPAASSPSPSPPCSTLKFFNPFSKEDDPEATENLFNLLREKGPYVNGLDDKDRKEIYSLYYKAGPKARSQLWEDRVQKLERKLEEMSQKLYLMVLAGAPKFWPGPNVTFPQRKEAYYLAKLGYSHPLEDPYPYLDILRCPFSGKYLEPPITYIESHCKKSDEQFLHLHQELEEICLSTAGKAGSSYRFSEADLSLEAQKIALEHKLTLLSPEDVNEAVEACLMLRKQKELCDNVCQLFKECLQMKQDCGSYDEEKVDKITDAYMCAPGIVIAILDCASEAPDPDVFINSSHKRAWEEVKEDVPKRAWYLKRKLHVAKLLGL